VTVEFPATRERRIYARGTPVLKRVRFGVGESVEEGSLLVYVGGGKSEREDVISEVTSGLVGEAADDSPGRTVGRIFIPVPEGRKLRAVAFVCWTGWTRFLQAITSFPSSAGQ
jgi:ATP-dependent helicase HepA